MAVLPVNEHGRHDRGTPLLAAHADAVTDMAFSPFDDSLLATGSADCSVSQTGARLLGRLGRLRARFAGLTLALPVHYEESLVLLTMRRVCPIGSAVSSLTCVTKLL